MTQTYILINTPVGAHTKRYKNIRIRNEEKSEKVNCNNADIKRKSNGNANKVRDREPNKSSLHM